MGDHYISTSPTAPVCPLIFSLNLTHLAMDVVVVSHERIKGAELHPANTQLFRRVPEEAADVSADEWNAIELELQQSYNIQQETTIMQRQTPFCI